MAKEKFYIGEFAQAEFNSFLETDICKALAVNITEFVQIARDTTAEQARVEAMIPNHTVINKLAFAIVTARETAPFESMIGTLASTLTGRNKAEQYVIDAHTVASEYILFSSNLMKLSTTT